MLAQSQKDLGLPAVSLLCNQLLLPIKGVFTYKRYIQSCSLFPLFVIVGVLYELKILVGWGFFFLGNFIEVKCFSCLLNLFSVYTVCKILDVLQRCLLSSHQIHNQFSNRNSVFIPCGTELCGDTPPSLRDQKGQCWSL